MMKKRGSNRQKRDLKAVKRLARKTRVPPTRVHEKKKGRRRRRRKPEEVLRDEGWQE
jgi:hypothetical protein